MRLSVATNFDPALVLGLRDYPVVELFGKLRQDAVGGGRAPYQLSKISRRQLAEHVALARKYGMGFNYLLNASCLGNREITSRGQRELEQLLGWLCDIGVESVTLASPLLLRMIKARYPQLRVRISVFAGIDRVRKAQMWEEMGADVLMLDSILVNREFDTLRSIREGVSCDLELMANNNCLSGCALSPMHMNALSHAGQKWHGNKGFLIDWCFLKCTEMKLRNPVDYLRSEWIRPEDTPLYEAMGLDLFKIAERDIPTAQMLMRVKAYSERRYDGNLLDLIQPYGFTGHPKTDRYYRGTLGRILRYLVRPNLVNPLKLRPLKKLAELRGMSAPVSSEPPVYIDNRALDGFIERFKTKGCIDQDCKSCRWCHDFADKAVRLNETHRRQALELYDELFESIESGDLWRYGRGKE